MGKRNDLKPVWHGLSLFSKDEEIWICFGNIVVYKYELFSDSEEFTLLPEDEWEKDPTMIDFRVYSKKDDGTYEDLGLFCESLGWINAFLKLYNIDYGKVYYRGFYKEASEYYKTQEPAIVF